MEESYIPECINQVLTRTAVLRNALTCTHLLTLEPEADMAKISFDLGVALSAFDELILSIGHLEQEIEALKKRPQKTAMPETQPEVTH